MDALAPEHREVLVLRELNQLDYEAIAEIVGCPIGTVRSRLARAREALRVRLVEQDMLP
jgi:RNA polymerase sigma-70 factor (ECF subfamily)